MRNLKKLEQRISDYETTKLQEKFNLEAQRLEVINQEYDIVFGKNMQMMRRLFSSISSTGYYGFPCGLVRKPQSLNFFYLWQVVSRTELELQQKNMLDPFYTAQLKESLAETGVFLGMKFD